MKKLSLFFSVLLLAGIFFYGCQDNNVTAPIDTQLNKVIDGYDIVLVNGMPQDNGDGTYTWTWSITNTNPGNGRNGTYQNLSHWSFLPAYCLDNDDIISAFYGSNLSGLSEITPKPLFAIDASNTCTGTSQLFKFDFGTNGSTTMYYQVVVDGYHPVDNNMTVYWKAGTKCGSGTIQGIGCGTEPECQEETAWGGNSTGAGAAWWYYFDTAGDATQNIYAGQNILVGTVTLSGGNLTINLTGGWELQNVTEPVKIEGYNTLPTKRPAAGQFELYKGTNLINIPGNGSTYYAIHLDVQLCDE